MNTLESGLRALDGSALSRRASLNGKATLSVHVSGPAGSASRAVDSGGSDIEPEDRYLELFCLAKPIVALAVLSRCRHLGIDVATPLAPALREVIDVDGEVTVASLLSHGCRLPGVPAVTWMTTPVDERGPLLSTPQGPRGTHSYSDVQAGAILDYVWPWLAGEALTDTMRCEFERWGVGPDDVYFGGEAAASIDEDDLAPLWVAQSGRSIPMLHVLAPEYRRRQSIAFSAFSRPSTVHAIFEGAAAFLHELDEEYSKGTLPTGVARSVSYDEVHRREVGFFSGFFRTDAGIDQRFAADHEPTYVAKMGIGLGFVVVRPRSRTVVSCIGTVAGFEPGWPLFEVGAIADMVLACNEVVGV